MADDYFVEHAADMARSIAAMTERRERYLRAAMSPTQDGPRVVLDQDIKLAIETRVLSVEDGIVVQLVDDDIGNMLRTRRLTRDQALLLHLLRQKDPTCVPGTPSTIVVDERSNHETESGE